MRNAALILLLAACTAAASAQTPAKQATAPAKAKSSTAAKPAAKSAAKSVKAAEPVEKLPPGVAAIKAPMSTLYTISLRYQDEKVGDGALAEPGKLLKYDYTLWVDGADGFKIDSTDDHRTPVRDKDGKPVMDANGKPELGEPQPAMMIMGQDRPLPGWDQGLAGMKANGKRRIFIPWQLGLGGREIPQHGPTRPAIPAKSDLLLDVNLVDVTDAPKPPEHPAMTMPPNHPPMGAHPMPGATPKPSAPGAPATPAAPSAAPKPATSAAPAATPAPAPAAPAAPATAPAPAPPATPAQPQSK